MTSVDWLSLLRQAEQCLARKQWAAGAELAESVLAIRPQCAAAHQIVGLSALKQNDVPTAISRLEQALAIRPDLVASHNALGRAYLLLGDLDLAGRHIQRALLLDPEDRTAHFNRASLCLKRGQYREGWLEYEWRWACGLVAKTPIPRPRWDGSPLEGRSILIHTEQGMGDVLQFMRFLPLVKAQSRELVFACQTPMQALLRPTPCVDSWFPIDQSASVKFDPYAPLLSVAGLLGIDGSSISQPTPYVFADPVRVGHWRKMLGALPGLKVGLCWQGSPTFEGDYFRSIPLKHYAPLAEVPDVTLISLQKGAGVEQIEPNRANLPLRELGELDQAGAFVDRAAIIQNLDLVITSDTSIAHLAGAMGRPVWIALSTGSDWRWLIDRADSPWYPTAQLFRQKTLGDWPGVFGKIASALAEKAAKTKDNATK